MNGCKTFRCTLDFKVLRACLCPPWEVFHFLLTCGIKRSYLCLSRQLLFDCCQVWSYADFTAIFFVFVFLLLATLAKEAWLRFGLSDQYKVPFPVPVAIRFGRGDFVQIATAFQRDSGSHIGQQGLPDAPGNLKNSACCWNQELCLGQSGLSVSLWAFVQAEWCLDWTSHCSWLFLIVCCHKAVALSSCLSWG